MKKPKKKPAKSDEKAPEPVKHGIDAANSAEMMEAMKQLSEPLTPEEIQRCVVPRLREFFDGFVLIGYVANDGGELALCSARNSMTARALRDMLNTVDDSIIPMDEE